MSAIPTVTFSKVNPQAIIPRKRNEKSIGFDLVAISVFKKVNAKTTIYDTGIKAELPEGYYFEIIPKNCFCKSDYIMGYSIGAIDCDNNNTIMFAMTKLDETNPDISVPFSRAQLVLRKVEPCRVVIS